MKKKITAVLAVILLAVCLTGCDTDFSSYAAVGLVTNNTGSRATLNFISLSGTMTFKLKCDRGRQARLVYTGSLETGKATVTYKCGGETHDLFALNAGEQTGSSLPLTDLPDSTLRVLVTTDEKCGNGSFEFNIVYD
ncbi:MAG: hypothetical protein CW338_01750 [Clostridiales bacterium]|nr:hypothetical protein [Clostridiales bacterium]